MKGNLKNIDIPFLHKDLGMLKAGVSINICMNVSLANIKLLTSKEYVTYKQGKECEYWGGKIHSDTFILTIPVTGYWHIVVDTNGLNLQNNVKHLLWIIK